MTSPWLKNQWKDHHCVVTHKYLSIYQVLKLIRVLSWEIITVALKVVIATIQVFLALKYELFLDLFQTILNDHLMFQIYLRFHWIDGFRVQSHISKKWLRISNDWYCQSWSFIAFQQLKEVNPMRLNSLWHNTMSLISVSISSGNGLLPDRTKPLLNQYLLTIYKKIRSASIPFYGEMIFWIMIISKCFFFSK